MFIKAKVFPDSPKEEFLKINGDTFEVYLIEPARGGLANKKLISLIREKLAVKKVRITSGHLSRSKIIEVE